MRTADEQDVARIVVKLLQENEDVQSAVIELIHACPNVVKQY